MAAPAAGSGNRPLVRGVAALVVAVVVVVLLLFLLQLQSSPASSVASPTPPPEATLAPVTPPATATPTPIVAPTIYNGPTPSPPPTAPPTPQPTARPHATPRPTPTYLVPTILSFGAPSTVHCTGTETQMVHLTWKIAGGATGVIIGIDNPGEYEQIDQTSGSADVPFACSDDHHDYYITTVGGSGSAAVEHRTVTRSM